MSAARAAADIASALPLDHPLAQIARMRLDAHVRAERNAVKVNAPNAGFSGMVAGVTFTDGRAETDDPAALNYFHEAGYTVDGAQVERPAPEPPVDPRLVSDPISVGTRLRDASVDSSGWRR